jgi:hypothetical protein
LSISSRRQPISIGLFAAAKASPRRLRQTHRHDRGRDLAFANTLLHSLCNQIADAVANDWIIEQWIEFVRRKGLLRWQDHMTARTITVRFLG